MCLARLALPPPFRFAPQGAIGEVKINERKDRPMSKHMAAGWWTCRLASEGTEHDFEGKEDGDE